MSDNNLEHFIAEVVNGHRPQDQPPFETLETRWRRRRTIRRTSAVAAVAVIAAAVAVPAALLDRHSGRHAVPPGATDLPSPIPSRPIGRIPWDVTGVTACRGADCRTITDLRQVGLLADDINVSEPYPHPYCPTAGLIITLTFTGPREPYPVIEVMPSCALWAVRGETQKYRGGGLVRDSAEQAQRLGVVVHDCGVTSPYNGPENSATEFVGLSLDEAQSKAGQRGMDVRVFGQDGECSPDPRTDDLRLDRVNLYLEDGRVVTAARY